MFLDQVEWDEPVSRDKQNRVSPWETETLESLFIFPSLTSGLKRPAQSAFWGTIVIFSLVFSHLFRSHIIINIFI